MGLQLQYNNEHVKSILRLIGGLPDGNFPDNPRAGSINRILKDTADRMAMDIRRAKRAKRRLSKGALTIKGKLARQIQGVLEDTHKQIYANINSTIISQWNLANEKNTRLVLNMTKGLTVPVGIANSMNQLNIDALNAFLTRTENGFTLSDRVWSLIM